MIYKYVKREVKITPGKTFRLSIDVNTILHIEISNVKSKIKSELIGLKHNDYLIVSLPNIIGSEFLAKKINRNREADIICRYVYKGCAYGFRSNLKGIVTTPIKIMILQYPENIEECNFRRYQRIETILPSRIKCGTAMFYGSIIDISELGCRFAILNSRIDDNDIKIINNTSPNNVSIMLKLPGSEKDFGIPVTRRSITHEYLKISIGLEFNNLDTETQNILKRFIAEIHKYSVVA